MIAIRAAPALAVAAAFVARQAHAQVVAAEPVAPIVSTPPADAPPMEVQVVVQAVVDKDGAVESAVVVSHAPANAPASFDEAATSAVKRAKFAPSTRDGRPIRSRIEYVVVFHAPPSAPTPRPRVSSVASPPAAPSSRPDDPQLIRVRGEEWSSPRGVGDLRVRRDLLDLAPHEQTSEMLSVAPGFFVDHENGEGIGNDVYLRGFDLDHGSGIEMRVGDVPINIPTHIQGQGYADANFIIPEVVRSIRVQEGPYDPRQGDAAIVGSAYFDLGVAERGYALKSTYGSFDTVRVVGIVAPKDESEETFAAFSLRSTDGFGTNRASQSASVNSQYAFDIGAHDHVRLIATAYGARSLLAGVVRQDDVDAGRIGYYDSYPYFSQGQSVQAARVILGALVDHVAPSGAKFEVAPWFMWTDYRSRQNYTGDLESSQIDPAIYGKGDLFELTNGESAAGVTARFRGAPVELAGVGQAILEPGVYVRVGHTDQTKSLLDSTNLSVWDRRIDATLSTLDAGAYVDVDVRLWKKLHVTGGPRADLLLVSIDDHLAGLVPAGNTPGVLTGAAVRDVEGIAAGPRASISYDASPEITPSISYGEGFRSLDVSTLQEGGTPYSKIRSIEAGFRAETPGHRYSTSLAAFETWVGNELVFEAAAGGLETENASVRRGVVGSFVGKPFDWLTLSSALSVTEATFSTLVPGVGHYVPNIPPILLRVDAAAHGKLTTVRGNPVMGRVGVGYTFLSGRHLTDAIIGPSNDVLNARAAVRYRAVELGVDAYNVLGLKYADDAEYYISNFSFKPGQQPASPAIHITAAPPLTLLGSVTLYL